jgi:ERF superfamily protein
VSDIIETPKQDLSWLAPNRMQSPEVAELVTALSKAQAELKPAVKDSTNPHFKNRYASLESVIEAAKILNGFGLAYTQQPFVHQDAVYLRTTLYHSSGQWITSVLPVMHDGRGPQSLGSGITYSRRYCLATLLSIASDEDDDAEEAQKGFREAPAGKPQSSRPTTPKAAKPPTAPPQNAPAETSRRDSAPMPAELPSEDAIITPPRGWTVDEQRVFAAIQVSQTHVELDAAVAKAKTELTRPALDHAARVFRARRAELDAPPTAPAGLPQGRHRARAP